MLANFRYKILLIDKPTAEMLLGDVTSVAERLRSKAASIANLAIMMRNQAWVLNGEAIIIDDTNKVIGGRKRLLAAIQHDACFPSLVVWGVPSSSANTLDQQKLRTLTATYQAAGHGKSAGVMASGSAAALNVAKYGAPHMVTLKPMGGLKMLEDYPNLETDLQDALGYEGLCGVLGKALTIGLTFLTRQVDAEKSNAFMSRVNEAAEIMRDDVSSRSRAKRKWHKPDGDPVMALVANLEAIEKSFIGADGKRKPVKSKERKVQSGAFVQAWNAFADGQALFEFSDATGVLIKGHDARDFVKYDTAVDLDLPQDEVRAAYQKDVDSSRITAAIEVLTPAIAQDLLGRNGPSDGTFTRNRNLSEITAKSYAEDIKTDNFVYNGESIKILISGHLGDGQHRCQAVVFAKKPITTLVVRGVESYAFETLDQERPRTYAKLLREDSGHAAAGTAAEALKHLWRYRNTGILSDITPSNGVYDRFSEEVPGILEVADRFRRDKTLKSEKKLRKILKPGILAALHTIFATHDAEKAETFIGGLISGANLPSSRAVVRLRNHIMDTEPREKEVIKFCCQAWCAFIYDRVVEDNSIFQGDLPKPFDAPAGSIVFVPAPPERVVKKGRLSRGGYLHLPQLDLWP